MKDFLTDLADDIEAGASGITSSKSTDNGIEIVSTTIGDNVTFRGKIRRSGNYHAIDNADTLSVTDLTHALSNILYRYIKDARRILVIGFGNADYVTDRLGVETLKGIDIDVNNLVKVVCLAPLVESVTGVSSVDMVKMLCENMHADKIIAVDTLSTSNIERLARCIQITDAGINPGSGIGNDKGSITSDNMGVPIVAIGVPLVISAKNICGNLGGNVYLSPSMIDGIVSKYASIMSSSINDAISRI